MKFIVACFFILCSFCVTAENQLVVYTERAEHLVRPVFDLYTELTGIEIQFVTDKAGSLIERLRAEGKNTVADLLITVDAGNLWQATQAGLFAPVESNFLMEKIPEQYRDPNNYWFGLSIRARTIMYNTDLVSSSELLSYQQLSSAKWKNKLCLRTAKKVYNQSLVAAFIDKLGIEKTEKIVSGWVNNLAMPVYSSDTQLIKAIASGRCLVGIANHYYLARLQAKKNFPVSVYLPTVENGGTHVNITGAGLIAKYNQKQAARYFLEWLVDEQAQQLLAGLNHEFPINQAIAVSPLIAEWNGFATDELNLIRVGELQREAVMLMDRVGYH